MSASLAARGARPRRTLSGCGSFSSRQTAAVKETRVPAGTTLFDGASWNGVAIDSTCGGHGTCKKCKVRVASGEQAVSPVDPRAFTPDELSAGWRLACRAQAEADLVVEVPPLRPGRRPHWRVSGAT